MQHVIVLSVSRFLSYISILILNKFPDDEGGHIKQGFESRRQNDLYMRLGLLLGERRGRNKSRDSCTSLASLDAHTLASHNTSPVCILSYAMFHSSKQQMALLLNRKTFCLFAINSQTINAIIKIYIVLNDLLIIESYTIFIFTLYPLETKQKRIYILYVRSVLFRFIVEYYTTHYHFNGPQLCFEIFYYIFHVQVSTLTGSSEVEAATPLGRDSLGSLASMSLSAASNCSSSSPGSRRHSVNGEENFQQRLQQCDFCVNGIEV